MRLRALRNLIFFLFFVLFIDIFWMQLVQGPGYEKRSQNNRIRLVPEDATRGMIFDRNGIPLVENKLAFDVVAIPQEINDENKKDLFSTLGAFLGIDATVLADTFIINFDSSFSPVMLASNVPRDTALLIEQEMTQLPGIFVKTRGMREYIYGQTTAHIIGYVGKMREDEYPQFKKYGYQIKDVIGRSGIESSCDKILRGKPGGMQLEVDSAGSIIQVISYRPPASGENIHTTIDIKLQQLIYNELEGETGAVCVMDSGTGEVLALCSAPAYDPNILIDKKRFNEIGRILKDSNSMLLNRAINAYAPGSIFKIVTAYAALDKGIITPETSYRCSGQFTIGDSTRSCWLKRGHGWVNLREAIATSCNVFFWQIGKKVKENNLAAYSKEFGLGRITGIELPGERAGVVPSSRWKKMILHQKWYGGDTVNFAIGQGYLLNTPVQALKLVGIIANGGKEISPHVVMKKKAIVNNKIVFNEKIIEDIRDGMFDVVNTDSGTGRNAFVPGVKVFGKTGTAQVQGAEAHAWFIGYAEVGERNISFVVFLEHGGHGGEQPAEIAKQIIMYFNQ